MGLADVLAARHGRLQAFEAVVSRSVSGLGDDALYVVIPTYDDALEYGPCPWQPNIDAGNTAVFPTKGDRALAIFPEDQEEEPWVVSWTPA